jgi:hypothetical protein
MAVILAAAIALWAIALYMMTRLAIYILTRGDKG